MIKYTSLTPIEVECRAELSIGSTRPSISTEIAVHNQTEAPMGKVRVAAFGVSIDGFGAGPDQSLEHPLGKGGRELHNWF